MRIVERARIVLFAASGQQDKEIAAVIAITPKEVSRWRQRFLALGVAGPSSRAFICTSLLQAPPGSTWWSVSFAA
jgi:hypothetical protein